MRYGLSNAVRIINQFRIFLFSLSSLPLFISRLYLAFVRQEPPYDWWINNYIICCFLQSPSRFSFRESLFQPVFKNKVTQSPMPSGLRFSTFGYLDSSTPSPPPPPSIPMPGAACPTHSQSNKGTMPHQHQHHHHYHHLHSSTNQSSPEGIDKGTGTNNRMDEFRATIDNDDKQKKFIMKKDDAQARSFSDVRKSAPDVIIIAGCNTSHWRF